ARPRRIFRELAVVEPRLCRTGGDRFGRFADDQHVRRHVAGMGWRIPFAVGLLIGPVGYYIRNQLDETPEFVEAGEARTPLRDLFVGQWDRLLLTIGAVAASTSSQ